MTGTPTQIGRRTVRLTNLDKVLYPATGMTKGEVIEYLVAVAPALVTHAAGRPVTLKRWVHGVGTPDEPGQVFFQKNLPEGAPDWVPTVDVVHTRRTNTYPVLDESDGAATLAWFGQLAALEVHVPQWRTDRDDTSGGEVVHHPDRLVLDLDPGPGAGLSECVAVARVCREIVEGMGLTVVPVTSGSKGVHLYAGLDGSQTSEQVSAVARELARSLEKEMPQLVVSSQRRTERTGKVLLDWSQNSGAKTTVAPYSLRGRERPAVAAPRSWDELDDGLAQLGPRDVLRRLDELGDLLAPLALAPPATPRRGRSRARSATVVTSASADPDPLGPYRAKRDQARTPEPFPVASASPARDEGRPVFVIQDHHARRRHHDLRLEHEGVLLSWALPRLTPSDPARNHLAVRTEDHPLEYATFEGTIPRGEYGAGTMTIWDSGTYQAEKLRADEVIVELDGAPGGGLATDGGPQPVVLALVRTDAEGDRWLAHRVDPARRHRRSASAPHRPRSDGDAASLRPMLATATDASDRRDLVREAVLGGPWTIEMKWDGIRALCTLGPDGNLVVRTRNGIDVTASFPELGELRDRVVVPAVLDGEIVAPGEGGAPDFGPLQTRLGLTDAREVAAARSAAPVELVLFDVLDAAGRDLTPLPIEERREALAEVVDPGGAVALSDVVDLALADALEVSGELGFEGVVLKRRGSSYRVGQRSADWRKVKHVEHTDVVVVGWRPGRGSRGSTLGSLLVARRSGDGLVYAGRVGSGLDDRQLARLRDLADKDAGSAPLVAGVPAEDARDARWLAHGWRAEVAHSGVTAGGRLRHPVWRGLRPDLE
ncbi:non-homologous end-joining DNA ligase [Sanguibacter sp. A247]|uniref:non-homologous end-joining DNA ligase n=1 Tax=unclassified Sanguibacter TaxID=2645534 RepID=UPI003FD7F601